MQGPEHASTVSTKTSNKTKKPKKTKPKTKKVSSKTSTKTTTLPTPTTSSKPPTATAPPTSPTQTANPAVCPTSSNGQYTFCAQPAFTDEFDTFDLSKWKHEITMSGGGNWEFEWYTNNRTNSFVKDGLLYLKPTLTSDNIGEDAVSGKTPFTMDINGAENGVHCTDPSFYGCSRGSDAGAGHIINPIQSARISTFNSFSMRYGRVEVKAQIPSGDWIWPAIWMMPKYASYGNWPSSGEIDIMESRGNKPDAAYPGQGTETFGSTLHWGPSYQYNGWAQTHKDRSLPSGQSFADGLHVYGLEWTPEYIKTYVDTPDNVVLNVPFSADGSFWNKGVTKAGFPATFNNPWQAPSCPAAAPFDQEFYIILNVAVGGTNDFFAERPNKPWKAGSSTAAADFWKNRAQWLPTWKGDNVAMKVDSVKAWKLC
ncbi:uncharacterized protein EV422DRAFT_521447 [Fimicolochytrium jonesii]|uniref:uncharacterized protein n=1 Tax=Fimicolochytrium jonesii TaxID=1396493 RepID=UPI0022FE0C69|nr:uncharacterized protein EV422DRAFT_521447 [Fimicolochytrium jonesii]KAI8823561.1 hypothetical protein EV422DRAFT_521447 [Fimicolochytrium jonesii]